MCVRPVLLLFFNALTFLFVLGQNSVQDIYVLGLFPMDGIYGGGQAIKVASEITIKYVNRDPNILPGYRLKLVFDDTKCSVGHAVNIFAKRMCQDKQFIIILGAGCSLVSEMVARTAPLWNLVQISYHSTSVSLSSVKKFPNFFRVTPSDYQLNSGRLAILRYFNWTRVATIHHSDLTFLTMMNDVERRMQEENIYVKTTRAFIDDCRDAVRQLKEFDARIVIGGFYENKARQVFCEAYKIRFGGPKVVWLLPGFYNTYWWQGNDTDCTGEEIFSVLGNYLTIEVSVTSHLQGKDDNGITLKQFHDDFFKMTDNKELLGFPFALTGYDAVWVIAHALNATVGDLKKKGIGLEHFSYTNSAIKDMIKNNMVKVQFNSLSGFISFLPNGDITKSMVVAQFQGKKVVNVGAYKKIHDMFHLIWSTNTPLKWANGETPKDSMHVVTKQLLVSPSLYISMCVCAAFGIALAICFLAFNIRYRSTRIIKMSSPDINNIILMGCIILYSYVFIDGLDTKEMPVVCKIKPFVMIIGFCLVFGSLFAKTWRVYIIFLASKKLRIRAPKDFHLFIKIGLFTAFNVSIVILWNVVDPIYSKEYEIHNVKVRDRVNDVLTIPAVWYCESDYNLFFYMILLIIQGMLLVFGVFLAITTRKVTIPALNDSKAIGMCIYNVIVLGLVGLPASLLLQTDVNASFGVVSVLFIAGTTSTQCVIFVPKVVRLKKYLQGDDTQCCSTIGLERSSAVHTSLTMLMSGGK